MEQEVTVDTVSQFMGLVEAAKRGSFIANATRRLGAITLALDWQGLFTDHVGPDVVPVRPYGQLLEHRNHGGRGVGDCSVMGVAPVRPVSPWMRGTHLPPGTDAILMAEATVGEKFARPVIHVPVMWRRGKWLLAPGARDFPGRVGAVERVNGMQSMALHSRYSWIVNVRKPGGAWVEVWSTPSRTMDVFRLRDIPDGKRRRDALLNWVSAHKRRVTPSEEVDVCRHLRGAQAFTIDGMECRVSPPEYDLERIRELATGTGGAQ